MPAFLLYAFMFFLVVGKASMFAYVVLRSGYVDLEARPQFLFIVLTIVDM